MLGLYGHHDLACALTEHQVKSSTVTMCLMVEVTAGQCPNTPESCQTLELDRSGGTQPRAEPVSDSVWRWK